ncbi:MAG: GAF domain-containing protein [Chloroflexales bacterium]|nr:GAF domain-containing protein [Chloroflexales bacterium]
MIRVLILDDDELFCRTLADSLRRNQEPTFAIVEATTAKAAQREVTAAPQPFDVFLIDQRLGPGADGIDVFQMLRCISPNTEAIIFTGIDDPDTGLRAYQHGAYRYLPKPFDTRELIWILRSLSKWRDTRYERDWLKVLNEVAEQTQRALMVCEVVEIVVQGGRRLGFERVRLWQMDADEQTLVGVYQIGSTGLEGFAGFHMAISDSPYMQQTLQQREAVFFQGQALGASYLYHHFAAHGFEAPIGEWASIPLWSNDRLWGVLSLDNSSQSRPLLPDQRHQLQLYGRHAVAALEQARLYELETRKSKELEILNQLGRHIVARAARDDLEMLLREVRAQVGKLIDVHNFMVVLFDAVEGQLDFRLHVENTKDRPYQRRPIGVGLVSHVITQNEPFFLPRDVQEYCKAHGIRPYRPWARCWLGVPLRLEGVAIGAIVVQDYEREGAYTNEDRRLLMAVADQVAGAIQMARLKEQEAENRRRLAALNRASMLMMSLAEERESWFWHATLTAITAGYALGFNRAALFLAEENGKLLRGKIGIGYFNHNRSRQSWNRQRRYDLTFDGYLQQLRAGELQATPVEQLLPQLVIDLSQDSGAFSQALKEGKRVIVRASDVKHSLPPLFVATFGITDYAITPFRTGSGILGLLVVDNADNRLPLQAALLDQLETLLTQAALIYANLRQRQTRDNLIMLNHTIMSEANNRPLGETLSQICQAAQAVVGADCVLIYPLNPDCDKHCIDKPEFDHDYTNLGRAGLLSEPTIWADPSKTGLTIRIIQLGPLVISDTAIPQVWFDHKPLSEHTFLKRERIQALVGVPVRDVVTNEFTGVLYLNYRTAQEFTEQDVYHAEAFANLASVAIRTGRYGQEVQRSLDVAETQRQARQRELEILGQVLQKALTAETGEEQIAKALLDSIQQLLDRPQTVLGLLLRKWEKPECPDETPHEVRHQYHLHPSGRFIKNIEKQLYRGMSGLALRTGRSQLAADVKTAEWSDWFYVGQSAETRSELDVPIRLDGRILGVLNAESPAIEAFDASHSDMMERMAATAALAFDNIQRLENMRNVLDAVGAVVAPSTLQNILVAVSDVARRVAPGISALTIWYQEPESKRIRLGPHFGVHNQMNNEASPQRSVVWAIMSASEPIWAVVAREESRLLGPFITTEQIESVAALPLRADDEVIGALFFNYRERHEFSDEERVLFPIIAAITAASVRDAARLEAMSRESKRLKAAMTITEAVGAGLDIGSTLRTIMSKLQELLPHAVPGILIYNSDDRMLMFHSESLAFYRIDNPDYCGLTHFDLDELGLATAAARESLATKQIAERNAGNTSQAKDYLSLITNTNSEFCMTLMSSDRLMGVLILESSKLNAFDTDDVALIRSVGQQVSIALDRAYQTAELRFKTAASLTTTWAADIAHDINREVSLIRSRAYWISEEAELSEKGRQYIQQIDESADRLSGAFPNSTVRQLVSPRVVHLDEQLAHWVGEIVAKRGAAVTVAFESTCRDACVQASPAALQRVLRHLVHNALEAMADNGQLTVRIQRLADNRIEVQVEDSGPGVPDYLHSFIFQQQVTTKKNGGLGLILVRLLLEEMGGSIRLLPAEPSRGAVFAFRLPIQEN